jgi:hypothetical protein
VRPLREQLERVPQRERRHRPRLLAVHPQGLAAGGEHDHGPALTQQLRYERGTGVNYVLAVVEHEQQRAVPQAICEQRQSCPTFSFRNTKRAHDVRTEKAWIGQ